MINKQDKLEVFENFITDESLPKFDKKSTFVSTSITLAASNQLFFVTQPEENGSIIIHPSSVANALQPFYKKLFYWFVDLFRKKQQPDGPSMTIEEFFASVKSSSETLDIVLERAHGYKRSMLNAKRSGQRALYEQLESGLGAYKAETQLVGANMTKFIKEEDVVRFYKGCKKGLRLDWVKNFTRTIPEDIIDKKLELDALGVFDNYVILHYDPDAKSYAETQQEKERRKDPILFGVMKGKRQLYFVGDWIDELCDLTLDQVADALGSEVIKEIS